MSSIRARPSSLKFQRSMRESSAPFMGMCLMRDSGNIVTYDEYALRLWSTTKQLKAHHHDPVKLENLKFMYINSIDEISCFVIIFSLKKPNAPDEKGGCMRIYSEQLQLLQEIEIKLPPIERVLHPDNQQDLFVFDKEKNAHILRLEIIAKPDEQKSIKPKSDIEGSLSTISHSLLPTFNKSEKPDYNPKPKKIELAKLFVIQRIDSKQVDVKDVILLDPNRLMILTGANLIMILTRPSLRPDKEEVVDDGSIASLRKRKALEAKKRREIEANGGVPLPEKEFCDFTHTASLVLKLGDSTQRTPVLIKQVKEQMLLLCYNDGWVQIIQYCEKLLTVKPEEVLENPQIPPNILTVVLAEFQAHCGGISKGEGETVSKTHNSPIKSIFDATKCRMFGENGFIAEFFTLGTDLRIAHWGVRYTVSAVEIETSRSKTSRSQSSDLPSQASSNKSSKKSKKKVEEEDDVPPVYIEELKLQNVRCESAVVEYLGDFHLQDSAPSDVSQRLQADNYLQYTKLQLLQVAGVTSKPVALQLVGIYGGLIMFWDVLHAHKVISSWHSVVTTEKDTKKLNPMTATTFDLAQMVTKAVRGPDLETGSRSFGGQSVLDILPFVGRDVDTAGVISTALLMKGDNLDVINTDSGERLQSFPLNHVMEVQQELSWSQSVATTGVLDRDQYKIRTQETSEVRATSVHYCPYSQFIVAGYQTGIVGIMNFREPIYGSSHKKANYSYLRSNKVHDSDITLLKTFPFKFYPYSNVGISTLSVNDTSYQYINNDIIVALVGDAQGVISLWQLYPQRKGKSPLLFHNKQHLGKLQFANMAYVPKNLRTTLHPKLAEKGVDQAGVLVTGCDRGMIYAWRVESNLHLQMIAYIHSTELSDPRLMTSLTIIPKMVYRTLFLDRPPEKTLLSSLTMYLRMKGIEVPPPQNEDVEVANLYFELYCLAGFSDGKLEVWSMSTDPNACIKEPIVRKKDYECPLVSLLHVRTNSSNPDYTHTSGGLPLDKYPFNTYHNVPNSIEKEFVLVNEISSQPQSKNSSGSSLKGKKFQAHLDEEDDFFPLYDEDTIMATYKDGTVLMYKMRLASHESDDFIKLRLISNVKLPSTVTVVLPLSPLSCDANDRSATTASSLSLYNAPNKTDLGDDNLHIIRADCEYLAVSEFEVDIFFPMVSKENILPKKWSQPFLWFEKLLMMRSLAARGNFSKNEFIAKTMSLQRLYAHKHQIPKSTKLPLNLIDYPNRLPSGRGRFTDTLNTENNSMAPSRQTDDDTMFSDDYSASSAPKNDTIEEEDTAATMASFVASEPVQEGSLATHSYSADDPGTLSKQTSVSTLGGNRRQYVGPMETMQRIMSSDLHFAKKDKRLLELFTHNVDNTGSYMDSENYTVSPEQAIEIVYQWTNEDRPDSSLKCYLKGFYETFTKMQKANASAGSNNTVTSNSSSSNTHKLEIKQDNLRELFKLLEIQPSDRLKFIEVAKVAAITASALQRSLSYSREESNAVSARKTYKSLKSTKTKVTYNSMGEKVFEKITISDDTLGKPTGMANLWRKALYATIENWRTDNMTLPVTPNKSFRGGVDGSSNPTITTAANMISTFSFSPRPSSPGKNAVTMVISTTVAKPRLLHHIPVLFKKFVKPMAALQPLLNQQLQETGISHAAMWTEEHIHYFDILRTIRIVRSLFDMRSVRQYEVCQTTTLSNADPKSIETMVQLVIKYFERQYGELSPTMNISRYKIINFLEACMQYSNYHPLIKVMQDVLKLSWRNDGATTTMTSSVSSLDIVINNEGVTTITEKNREEGNEANSGKVRFSEGEDDKVRKLEEEKEKGRELALWLVTEVRNMLISRGLIVLGDVIDKKFPFEPEHPVNAYTNILDTKSGNKLIATADYADLLNQQQDASWSTVNNEVKLPNTTHNNHNRVRWLYISVSDAMYIADEMLRVRAKLGPYLYMTVFQAVEGLPLHTIRPPTMAESSPPIENMVNMEKFLEALYFEFIRQDDIIRKNRQLVFGEYSQMNVASSAYPREINSKLVRPLVIDDQDLGFGTYHQKNMSRIQDLLNICIKYDPLRTGELSEEAMEEILMEHWILPAPYVSDSKFPALESSGVITHGVYEPKRFECIQLIKISHEKMKIKSIEDKISYIDMIALLLSWEEHQQGSKKLSFPELLSSLPGIVRTIEIALARDLIRYFTTVSAMEMSDYENPLWVMGLKASQNPFAQSLFGIATNAVSNVVEPCGESDSAVAEANHLDPPNDSVRLSLPMDGVWRPVEVNRESTIPDDRPGMLHVRSAVFHAPEVRNPNLYSGIMKTSASTPALLYGTTHGLISDEHSREMQTVPVPHIIETTRIQASVLGESIKLNNNPYLKIEPAKITIQKIDGSLFGQPEMRGPYSPKKITPRQSDDIREDAEIKLGEERIRSSYSRVLENFTTNALVGAFDFDPPPKNDDIIESVNLKIEEGEEIGSQLNQSSQSIGGSQSLFPDLPDNTIKITFREIDSQSYGLMKEDSLDTADSNYQRYDLAFLNQDSTQLFPQTPPDENGVLLPDARPLTRQQAVLTPFLDFRESDIEQMLRSSQGQLMPSQSSTSVGETPSLLQSMNRSLASEELSKRIRQLQTLESEFATMYNIEKEEYEKRRKEKELLREQIRREMLWKQREAMKVYHKSLEDRQKRMDKGRALLKAAQDLEMQDKMAKELEIQALLEENKAKTQQRLHDKANAEVMKKEMEKEAAERERMKKEEKVSDAFNKFRREEERKAKEALKKQQEEEFAALLRRQKEQLDAAAAAAASLIPEEPEPLPVPEPQPDPPVVEHEASGDPPKQGRRKGLLDGDEDDDDDDDDEDDEEEEGDDEEDEEEEEPDDLPLEASGPKVETSTTVSAEEREYRMSLADKIMQRILENIDEAYVLHKTHPRNKHDGDFFIPLMFSEDIAFNSFKNSFNDLIHQQIREKQEEEEARRLIKSTNMDASEVGDDMSVGEEDEDDVQTPLDPFQDIKNAVKKYRRRAEKQRKALFKTEMVEVPTKDWMPVFRKGYADWQAFFNNEKKKREIIEEIIQQIEEDDDFNLEKPHNQDGGMGGMLPGFPEESDEEGGNHGNGLEGSLSSDGTSVFDQIPPTLLQAIPQDFHRDIVPLPYGKVMKNQIVFPNEIKFYQIEVTDANVILTIELKCRKGLASGFLNFEKLPTTVKYMYKISCTKQNHRFARMSIIPEKGPGKYFFAVYSFDSGAEYDLWAYASGDKDSEFHSNPAIERVNKLLVKWDMILSKSEEELQTHFPRIEAEANIKTEKVLKDQQQTVKNKHAVLNEMRQLMKHNNLEKVLEAPSIQLQQFRENKRRKKESAMENKVNSNGIEGDKELDDDEMDFLEEMDNIEDFVVKVGRFAMKRSREILLAANKIAPNADDGSSVNSDAYRRPDSGASHKKSAIEGKKSKMKLSPGKTIDSDSVDTLSVSTAGGAPASSAALDLLRPVAKSKSAASRSKSMSVDINDDRMEPGIILSRMNSTSRPTSASARDNEKSLPPSRDKNMSRSKSRKNQLLLDDIENPNQHADLFSTPTSTKIAAINMIRPLRSNSGFPKKSPSLEHSGDDFFGEELLNEADSGKHLHQQHHGKFRRMNTVEEIQRVFDEENEKRREMDRTMANLPHLPGFSLKLAPSILEKQNRYAGVRESAFVGDNSLMSSTSSVLVKLPPINEGNNGRKPQHPQQNALQAPSFDTAEVLNRGIGDLSDRSITSVTGAVEKELAEIAAKRRPKIHNPLLMSNPKPISYNLKRNGGSKY